MAPTHLRQEYNYMELLEANARSDPFQQFQLWFDEAVAAGIPEVNAMTLATITVEGRPDARIVLLKGVDPQGFSFFTNYESTKSSQLTAHPWAALVFFWKELQRQVRIEGRVERTSETESDTYFRLRPRGSQIGAWASQQSRVIPERQVLEDAYTMFEQKFTGIDVPRPPHWGGFRLIPDTIEFWQGRPNRLHDRLRYRLVDGVWVCERLSP